MLALASILGTLLVVSVILTLTDLAERRLVAEPVLIARVVSAKRLSPEYVESFVASQAERLLQRG
ncbi:MAG TPA: hypothetical protein VFA11_11295 [Acidimicrobiales bacterium]|nr:hypothetical protein [Acidimicrobiales bacterium]